MLSVIAGYLEGEFYGTAINANFHLLRSEDSDAEYIIEEYFWVRAAEYADSAGCDIINTSLGYSEFDDSTQNHTYSDMDGNTTIIAIASDIASSKGILCITSAGNLGDSEWGYISTPADADSTLTVGAEDIFKQRASFSSYGPSSDGDIKPNVMSVGWNCKLIAPWDNKIIQANGTSFSSPMMAGMAACLWQALPDKTNMEIKELIETSSDSYYNTDSLTGYGTPNIYSAYQSVTNISYQFPYNLNFELIYPNPAQTNGQLEMIVNSPSDSYSEILIIDVQGKITVMKTIELTAGKNKVTIESSLLPSAGIYTLVIQNSNESFSEKLVIYR